jgi:hypothetical protein
LAIAAIVIGQVAYGWPGVALAMTCIVFWLLLQFTRGLRALRDAAGRPIGEVDNAVMLHARLQLGMRLPQILKVTRSLGRRIEGAADETFAWNDAAGDSVQVQLRDGRLAAWSLHRAAQEGTADAAVRPVSPASAEAART